MRLSQFVHLPQFVIFDLHMFGLEPPSIDMKNLNTKYEELLLYLYAEYRDTCGGGPKEPDRWPMFWI
jgi:hypothetical protein